LSRNFDVGLDFVSDLLPFFEQIPNDFVFEVDEHLLSLGFLELNAHFR
jgi:hypothetical protein